MLYIKEHGSNNAGLLYRFIAMAEDQSYLKKIIAYLR